MRIITKIILTIAICSTLGATAVSVYILNTPFSKEIPEDGMLPHSYMKTNEGMSQRTRDIENIHLCGTWEKQDQKLNITPVSHRVKADLGYSESRYPERINITSDSSWPTQLSEDKEKPILENITLPSGNFTIDEEQKIITLNKSSKNYSYRYKFTNQNNTLSLTNIETNETLVLQRNIPHVDKAEELESFVYQKVNISGNLSFSTDKDYGNLSLNESYKLPVCLEDVTLNQSFEDKKICFRVYILPSEEKTECIPSSLLNNTSYYLTNIEENSIRISRE